MRFVVREVPRAADLSVVLSVESSLGAIGESGKATILNYLEKTGMSFKDIPHQC